MSGVRGVWISDTEEEFENQYEEFKSNPDLVNIGDFDSTQDIDDELTYQGFTLEQIEKMSLSSYGEVLEVIEYRDKYYAFIGNR